MSHFEELSAPHPAEQATPRARRVWRWTLATAAGSALGHGLGRVPAERLIAHFATLGLGLPHHEVLAFALLGGWTGLCVGSLQARVGFGGRQAWRWLLVSVLGSAIGWGSAPVVSAAARPLLGAAGDLFAAAWLGLLLGGVQWLLAHDTVTRPLVWVGVNTLAGLGWMVGYGAALRVGLVGGALGVVMGLSAGLLAGLLTGPALVWMRAVAPAARAASPESERPTF